MKAIRLHAHGGVENIRVDDIDDPPAPAAGEIQVAIKAGALNHLDIWVRNGLPGLSPELPMVMGSDAAGEVVAVGEGVDFASGERVVLSAIDNCGRCDMCLSGEQSQCRQFRMRGEHVNGFFAGRVNVPALAARRIADDLSYEDAAAGFLTFLTAWRMLITRGRLRPGETVLIHGIGGGLALAALNIATLFAARVIVTSSDDGKLEKARGFGAADAINYKTEDVARRAYKLTAGRGVDVVVDSAGGDAYSASLKALRPGGRLVTCGATAGANPPADITRIFAKQIDVLGSTMGNARETDEVVGLMNRGKLRASIDRVFDAARIREAHAYLESAEQFGKVVLTL
ncbi:zinc-binding dehydrogenase [bacterium]|nr:zinc-binding dehydrogenase [bacterium]